MIASKKSVELLENAQIGLMKDLADMKANHGRRLRTIESQHGQQLIKLADKISELSSRLALMEQTMHGLAHQMNGLSSQLDKLEAGRR